MKNIKWVIHSYRSEQDFRYLIDNIVGSNFISTVGAFVSAPVRKQAFEVLLKKIPRKNY
jgi:hypothetical protein